MLLPLIAAAAALLSARATPADTVRADSLVRELPAIIDFQMYVIGEDTLGGLFVSSRPRPARLAVLAVDAPFAGTWLLQDALSYEQNRRLNGTGTRDTVAVRRRLLDALAADTAFTIRLITFAAPVLRTHGTTVTGLAIPARGSLTRATLLAFAARYVQADLRDGRLALTLCAKPAKLSRPAGVARDDMTEAWLYSILRSTVENDPSLMQHALATASAIRRELGAAATSEAIQERLWTALVASPQLASVVEAGLARTASWAPVQLESGR